jgi:hypothetical protein
VMTIYTTGDLRLFAHTKIVSNPVSLYIAPPFSGLVDRKSGYFSTRWAESCVLEGARRTLVSAPVFHFVGNRV